jgi:EmrB/QacA subfamily drug resistance transporter
MAEQRAVPDTREPGLRDHRGRWSLLTEPPRPGRIARRPNAFWYAVVTVCLGAFMGQLDASIVTLAFPTMEKDFHATSGAVTWVGLAYLLTLVAMLPAVGRYADMFGRKLFYTYGFLLFILGSGLCGVAPTLYALIAFRVLQALGAAMLQANSVAIIANAAPPDKLGRAIGVQGAAQALGLALGPAAGGFLIAVGGWRLIFYVNVPVGLVATVLAWFLIPRSRHLAQRSSFDWAGLGLLIPSVLALLLVFSFGDQYGWTSPLIIVLIVVTVAGTALFIRTELRAAHPMLDLSYFRRAQFSAGIASGWLIYLVIYGILYVVPYFLERGLGFSSARTGAELLIMPLGLGVMAPIAGRIADRTGAQPLMLIGMSVSAATLVVMAFYHTSLPAFLVELALAGAGLGVSTAPNNAATMGAVPPTASGMASGTLNMSRGLGTAMGLALTQLVFALAAGPLADVPSLVRSGFSNSAIFLAVIAAVTIAVTAFRGNGALSSDRTAQIE